MGKPSPSGEVAYAYKHGHDYRSPTYRSWKNMKVRCTWGAHKQHKDYAGRGITMCDEWLDFRNFLRDMGERPDGMTLERRDNDGPYCKENCEWATRTTQNRNSRNCRPVVIDGKRMLFGDACRSFGKDPSVVRSRLKRGIPLSEAFK